MALAAGLTGHPDLVVTGSIRVDRTTDWVQICFLSEGRNRRIFLSPEAFANLMERVALDPDRVQH